MAKKYNNKKKKPIKQTIPNKGETQNEANISNDFSKNKITEWITAKRIYYIILVILSTIFVIVHWCKVITFTFFSSFDGYNLAFLLWLALLILPIFDVIDIFGVKIKSPFAELLKDKTDELTAKGNINSYNVDDIEKQLSALTGKAVDNDVE